MKNSKQNTHTNAMKLGIGERKTLLIIGDFTVAVISLVISLYFWGSSQRFMEFSWEFIKRRTPLWFYFLPVIWILLILELYDLHNASNLFKTAKSILIAAAVGFLIYVVLFFYYVNPPRSLLPRRGVASFLITVSILTFLWRFLYIKVFSSPQFMRRVLIVGGGEKGEFLINLINDLNVKPFLIIGIVDDDPAKLNQTIQGYPVLGTSENLEDLIDTYDISDLFVTISGYFEDRMFKALLSVQQMGIRITSLPVVYEELLRRVPIDLLKGDWILRTFVNEARVNNFYELGKRVFDILGSLVGLLFFLLFLPIIGVAIWIESGRPIFYLQTRLGRGGRTYQMIKFRTMYQNAEADGIPRWADKKDKRATRLGWLLRKTHLDELPQFINVLKGEMSLVGPRAERPELVEYFGNEIRFYKARLMVAPGLTGWAQVNYGYAATIEETKIKLEYDLYYIKNRSMLLDFLILLRTPATVLGLRGR